MKNVGMFIGLGFTLSMLVLSFGCGGDPSDCVLDSDCEDAQVCSNGRCVDPEDPCADIVCDDPPADTCDGNSLMQYPETGLCDGGDCTYSPNLVNCPYGCAEGVCMECTPDCVGKECGPDGCGGTCGPGCGMGETCDETSGRCEVDPSALKWLSITGSTFQMGSDAGTSDELPIHSVTVSSFEMTKTEVMIEQYQVCVDAGTCTLPNDNIWNSRCNWGYSDRGAHPVNCVDWDQAVAFCAWAGGRLPSEAEWEYAARSGGQDIIYPWGDETATCEYAVMNDEGYGCGEDSTWAVCGKTAGNTEQELCDMTGNVWEWVQDRYHNSYTGAPADGSAWEDSGSYRVLRGGSFKFSANALRLANRSYDDPSNPYYDLGFRCAR